MDLYEPIPSMDFDDILMGTDAGVFGLLESLMPSGTAGPSAAQVFQHVLEKALFEDSEKDNIELTMSGSVGSSRLISMHVSWCWGT